MPFKKDFVFKNTDNLKNWNLIYWYRMELPAIYYAFPDYLKWLL